jgi:hypothetical protein
MAMALAPLVLNGPTIVFRLDGGWLFLLCSAERSYFPVSFRNYWLARQKVLAERIVV